MALVSDFLQKRIDFLDALWLENEAFYKIEVKGILSNLYVSAGMTAEELPANPEDPQGIWYLEGTDLPFDVTQPVTGDVSLSPLPASETPPPTEEATPVETVIRSSMWSPGLLEMTCCSIWMSSI